MHAFKSQLNGVHAYERDAILKEIPQIVTDEQHDTLAAFLTLEEIHDVIKKYEW